MVPGSGELAPDVAESLQRLIYREFLAEPDLYREAGLEELPAKLAERLELPGDEALSRLLESPTLEELDLGTLRELLAIRDMRLISRTAASVAGELKDQDATYERCLRLALCYAVAGLEGHVFAALRAAAAKHDEWARHHFLYGLIHGLGGNSERAIWELDLALQREPYEDGRWRIRRAIELLEGDGPVPPASQP